MMNTFFSLPRTEPYVKRYTFTNNDKSYGGTYTVRKLNSNLKKLRKLQYNFKELSSMLLQAKTSNSASKVVRMARSKAAILKRKLKTGEYDDKEVESAVIHAEAMVRIAKKRVRHLQAEENAARKMKDGEPEFEEELELSETQDLEDSADSKEPEEISKEEFEALMREMQQMMEEGMDSITEELGGLDELADALMQTQEETDPEEFKFKKRKNRSDELREIVEADMKYLKAMFDRLEHQKQSASCGVTLQLGTTQIPASAVVSAPVVSEGGNVDVTV